MILLVESMKSELEDCGIDPHKLTNKGLKRHVGKSLKGGSVAFGFPLKERQPEARRKKLRRTRRVIIWFSFAAVLPLQWIFGILFSLLYFLGVMSCIIGTTVKSRVILALFFGAFLSVAYVFGTTHQLPTSLNAGIACCMP
jgi:hypothetical protein